MGEPRRWVWVREFSWGDEHNRYEVDVTDAHLQWTWFGPKDLGGSTSQSFEDFWRLGPLEEHAPDEVIVRVRAAVRSKLGDRAATFESHRPSATPLTPASTQVEPSQGGGGQSVQGSPETAAEALDERRAPLWRVLAVGTLVFVLGIVPPTLLVPYAPLGAGYLGLFLPVLLGFVLGFRGGGQASVVAGFFSLAGASAMVMQYQSALGASGAYVELDSVADILENPGATRFAFVDAWQRADTTGSATSRTWSGKTSTTWQHLAVPLVSRHAAADTPVVAWLVCTTTPGFNCLPSASDPVRGAVRSDDARRSGYLVAVRTAEQTYGLTSAAGAVMLEIADDPKETPARRYVVGLVAAWACWLTWAMGVCVLRLWETWRARSRRSQGS